jgi:hypothetical protein
MNKLFSLILAATILAATPLMAMDEPEKGVYFSSQTVKKNLQHAINRIIEVVSEDYTPQQLTPASAKGSAETVEMWRNTNFNIRYCIGKREGMAFFLEGRQDAEQLFSIAYRDPKQKCTLEELQYVKKGAKFSPNFQYDNLWNYWVKKDDKLIRECLKEEDRYCTQTKNNHYPVLRYSVSKNPNQYLNAFHRVN